MKVDIYTEFNEDLKNIWTNFEKTVGMTPFQSFTWLNNWQQTVGSQLMGVQPQVVHLQDDGQTLAILPLCIRRKFGITILEWLGGKNTDYMGPLVIKNYHSILSNKKIWNIIKHKLHKKRYLLNYKPGKWIIDCFQGKNYPLVLAEVELESEDELVIKPNWCDIEISSVKKLSNAALAQHPIADWSKEELKVFNLIQHK